MKGNWKFEKKEEKFEDNKEKYEENKEEFAILGKCNVI